MNSVYVAKFVAIIGGTANDTCVTFTNDVRNNRNTVAFVKWDKKCSKSVQIEYENQ